MHAKSVISQLAEHRRCFSFSVTFLIRLSLHKEKNSVWFLRAHLHLLLLALVHLSDVWQRHFFLGMHSYQYQYRSRYQSWVLYLCTYLLLKICADTTTSRPCIRLSCLCIHLKIVLNLCLYCSETRDSHPKLGKHVEDLALAWSRSHPVQDVNNPMCQMVIFCSFVVFDGFCGLCSFSFRLFLLPCNRTRANETRPNSQVFAWTLLQLSQLAKAVLFSKKHLGERKKEGTSPPTIISQYNTLLSHFLCCNCFL